MNFADYFICMSSYNMWMNDNLYTVCDSLDEETRNRDSGAFFGSIQRTLDHILFGDTVWMERLRDNRFTPRKIDQVLFADWTALKAERKKMDMEIDAWVKTLDDASLAAPFTFTSLTDGKQRSAPKHVYVQHMFNHQTHHRGQLTTLLSQLGIDYGTTDMPFMPGLAV